MTPRFDHLVFAAGTLESGAEALRAALGIAPLPGGRHGSMGTWNRLVPLGATEYLEVIAIDPEAPPPGRARWFALDDFAGPPRLSTWVIACDDLTEAWPGAGEVMPFTRGDHAWRMAVPRDGRLPFANLQPAQILWDGPHPAPRLPDLGCRLERLVLVSPEAEALAARLAPLGDPRVSVEPGPAPAMRAAIRTPSGLKVLE